MIVGGSKSRNGDGAAEHHQTARAARGEPHANCICMYTPAADGGHPRYAQELLTALARHPSEAYRCELISSADLREQFRSTHYPIHAILPPLAERKSFRTRIGWIVNRLLHYPRRERLLLRWLKERPDVVGVHFQEWAVWMAAGVARRIRRTGKHVFYTVHNVVPHRYPRLIPKFVVNGWVRRACMQCNCLFVHTDRLAEELSAFLGDPHPPIQVVPHGVWTVRDADRAPGAPTFKERLAWKRLLFFGGIRRNKGLDLLLRAAEKLPGYSITIAGEPWDEDYYRNEILPLVKRLRDSGVKVELRDHYLPDEEVGPLFSSHSAIVLPYTSGFVAQSGVAFMALAYELPMVASEAGGLRDVMNEFRVGVTFNEHTPDALADAVHALYADATRLGLEEQIRSAKRRYSWHAAASATIAGYALADEPRRVDESDDVAIETTPAH